MKKRIFITCFAFLLVFVLREETLATSYSENGNTTVSAYRDDDLDIDPVDRSSIPSTWSIRGNVLPTAYQSPYVTSVKDQNPYGTCWAFAFLSASEASLVQEGIASVEGDDAVDLSELHLAYFTYHGVTDPLGGIVGDKLSLTSTATNAFLSQGGNQSFATMRVASWCGVVDEDIAPYDSIVEDEAMTLSDEIAYSKDLYHLENAYWISLQDQTTVKKLIMEYGACGASYYDSDAYYNVSNKWNLKEEVAFYCPDDKETNHAITIIGWDDNYSASNFGTNAPSADGAWYCKNSWGTDFSKDGYFWISYEDVPLSAGEAFFYDYDTADNYDKNYQYDGGAIGLNCFCNYEANIYTAQEDEYIQAVGFYTSDSNYDCTIKVYKDCDDNNPTSGILLTTVEANQLYAGFHTVDLENQYLLKEGDKFSVVIYQNATDGEQTEIATDSSYAKEDSWFINTSVAETGQSYVSIDGSSWQDISADDKNCRIKAYTDIRMPVTSVSLTEMRMV